jgi:poly-gamma-glutamate system protein
VEIALRAARAIALARQQDGTFPPAQVDPDRSGLIGVKISDWTSINGNLVGKQLSTDARFAALIVRLLDQAGVGQGSKVAVGLSGSFPALNIAVLAAIEALGAHAFVIAAATASAWGANHPRWPWPAMDAYLGQRRLLRARTIAFSLGGEHDGALQLDAATRSRLVQALRRFGVATILEPNIAQATLRRVQLLRAAVAGSKFAAYVNVGGSVASLGPKPVRDVIGPGLHRALPIALQHYPQTTELGVALFMLQHAVPVLSLRRLSALGRKYPQLVAIKGRRLALATCMRGDLPRTF